jgi:hypothetical protein
MDDRRTDRADSRWVAVSSRPTAVLLIAIGLIALPFILITLAIFEYNSFGTTHLMDIGRAIGIYEPINEIYRKAPWIWGYR